MSSFTEATFTDTGKKRRGRRVFRIDEGMRFYIGFVGSTLWVDVPAGFETDGPSAPAWAIRLLPSGWARTLAKPSAVHDCLREDLRYAKIDGDAIFLTAMKANDTPVLLRILAFVLVRLNHSRARAV